MAEKLMTDGSMGTSRKAIPGHHHRGNPKSPQNAKFAGCGIRPVSAPPTDDPAQTPFAAQNRHYSDPDLQQGKPENG